jgi:hypothetical protein
MNGMLNIHTLQFMQSPKFILSKNLLSTGISSGDVSARSSMVSLTKSHIENQQYWIIALHNRQLQLAGNPQWQAAEPGALDTESTANFLAGPSLSSLR